MDAEKAEITKASIKAALRLTKREGINALIDFMESAGFFTAPASSQYHGAAAGMLAAHSLNVYNYSFKLARAWCADEWLNEYTDSLTIVSLLHDLGKVGQFDKPLYVPNVLKTGISKAKPYKRNDDLMTPDHEFTSVILATKYIDLTEEEQNAIIYHNGMYTPYGRATLAGKERPLQMIVHDADMWASRVIEIDTED